MTNPEKIASKKWLESARLRLETARLLFEDDRYTDSLARAYFGVFHSAKALLAAGGLSPRTHSGTHTLLGREHRGNVDTSFASALWQEREGCDYRLYEPSAEHVERRLRQAEHFIRQAEQFIG